MVAAEHDRDGSGADDLGDRLLDRLPGPGRVGRDHGRVAEVHHPELTGRVDPGLEVRARRAARGADRARAEAGAGTVGDEIVGRCADDRHVDAPKLGGVLRVRERRERQQPRVVRLVAETPPPFERIDHRPILRTRSEVHTPPAMTTDAAAVSLLRWLRRQLREPSPLRERLEAAVANDDPAEARRLLARVEFGEGQRRQLEPLLARWERRLRRVSRGACRPRRSRQRRRRPRRSCCRRSAAGTARARRRGRRGSSTGARPSPAR